MLARIAAAVAILALSVMDTAVAGPAFATQSARVLHHERLERRVTDPAGRSLQFEAYGRRFNLALERNDRIRFVSAARTPGVETLRGSVDGAPGSWVRLTRTPVGLFGMLFDGRDLYAIEPAHELAARAVEPLQAEGDEPLIYRLADTLLPPGEAMCGTVMTLDDALNLRSRTALDAYKSLSAQLQAPAAAAASVPSRQIEVAVVADFEFSQLSLGGLTPEAAIAARMNVVDGIYSQQVGVKVVVTDVTVFRTDTDPFTTTVPSALLDELATWRQATPAQTARGLTHLMTGRDLDGTTVGIAFIGSLCRARSAAGLSQGTLSATSAALVIAHEMGHNFGAFHDGEAATSCETVPLTFIMAPRINGSQDFSQCSLGSMSPVIAAASCLTPLNVADADLDVPAAPRRLRGAAFDYAFNVRSAGQLAVDNVVVTVTLPVALRLNSASATGGASCVTGAGNTLSCTLGALAPQTSRAITLNLTGQAAGTANVGIVVTATNDALTANNSRSVTIGIDPGADLAITLAANPASFTQGGTSQVTATVRHLEGDAVLDARLTFAVPLQLTVTAVGVNALGCVLQNNAVSCAPSALAAGQSQSVALTVSGQQPGSRAVGASVSAALGDPVSTNNTTEVSIETTAPPPAAAGGGGGGGGSGTPGSLGLLALAIGVRAVRRRR